MTVGVVVPREAEGEAGHPLFQSYGHAVGTTGGTFALAEAFCSFLGELLAGSSLDQTLVDAGHHGVQVSILLAFHFPLAMGKFEGVVAFVVVVEDTNAEGFILVAERSQEIEKSWAHSPILVEIVVLIHAPVAPGYFPRGDSVSASDVAPSSGTGSGEVSHSLPHARNGICGGAGDDMGCCRGTHATCDTCGFPDNSSSIVVDCCCHGRSPSNGGCDDCVGHSVVIIFIGLCNCFGLGHDFVVTFLFRLGFVRYFLLDSVVVIVEVFCFVVHISATSRVFGPLAAFGQLRVVHSASLAPSLVAGGSGSGLAVIFFSTTAGFNMSGSGFSSTSPAGGWLLFSGPVGS